MRRIVSQGEAYKYWAETFDEGTPILALESRVLEPMFEDVAGARVVDVGCGTGRWLRWMMARGATAVGCDLSREMLLRPPRDRVARADGLSLPFRDGWADVALCALAMGHMRPVAGAMGELARIARPGGRVVVSDFHPEALRRGWKRTFQHGGETMEMESDVYDVAELGHRDLMRESFTEAAFGEQERHYFEAAGKARWFDENREQAAILVATFRRRA